MLKTSVSNALRNFLALHAKVADDKETVIVCGGRYEDVAWVDAAELERLRIKATRPRPRELTRICVALERAERRDPTSEEILNELLS